MTAASVADLMLTTDCMVAELVEEKSALAGRRWYSPKRPQAMQTLPSMEIVEAAGALQLGLGCD